MLYQITEAKTHALSGTIENAHLFSRPSMIADCVKKYFWDVDTEYVDIREHKRYILERILELGDEEAVAWMRKNFSIDDIASTLDTTRNMSRKSINFWRLFLQKRS